MLTADDEPIIRRALMRRLDSEPGVRVLEILIKDHPDHIAVGCLLHVDDKIIVKSVFDLEPVFYLKDVHNQADEIAEGCKEARKTLRAVGLAMPDPGAISEIFHAKGSGRRGFWRSHIIRRLQ